MRWWCRGTCGLVAIGLAAVGVAACGGSSGASGDGGAVDAPVTDGAVDAPGMDGAVCPANGQDLLAQIDQFKADHDQCQQAKDCVAVGIFRQNCDGGPDLSVAVNAAAQSGAQCLIDEAKACGDVPTTADDFSTPDVSCVKGHCHLGLYGMCLPGPPDARPPDAAPTDAPLQDAAPQDALLHDAAP